MDGLAGMKPLHLGVSRVLSLSPELRVDYLGWSTDPFIIKEIEKPYYQTIEKLPKIQEIENPILKLEFLFQLFTEDLVRELRSFWGNTKEISKNDLYIDADSLKAITIYILIQTKWSKLLVDILMIEEFSPDTIKMTNRAYYLTVLYSAFEYLEEMSELQYFALKQSLTISGLIKSTSNIKEETKLVQSQKGMNSISHSLFTYFTFY
jgi:hypothetical protein